MKNKQENSENSEPLENGEPSLEQRIFTLLASPNYRPAKPRVITKLLGLEQSEVVTVRRLIKRMERAGKIAFGPKHLVMPISDATSTAKTRSSSPDRQHNLAAPPKRTSSSQPETGDRRKEPDGIRGTFRKTSQAFGFVTPSDYFGNDRAQDIFIPPRQALDASDRDTVLVRLSTDGRSRDNRKSGRIIKVLERKTHRFVGTYHESGNEGWVVVDNEQFDAPVLVGDASAKNGRVGDKVVIEMVRFPEDRESGEAVIIEVLGSRGQPGVDTQMIIAEFGLPGEFPANVLQVAHAEAERFEETVPPNRTDFTNTTVVTIDPKTARDFDDAISLERLDNGNWSLGVHIADVSHFVQRGTALDDEAYQRATSVYLPDKVIPMLPEVISNNLSSLQPHRLRYTMSVVIEITDAGEVRHAEWHRGAIKSAHRFTYEDIDEYLEDSAPWRERLSPPIFELVRNMHSLAMTMRRRRMDRGSFDLSLPDVSIDLDEEGRVAGAHIETYTESHQLIEEFMLAANGAVAQKLFDLELFYLRRIHEPPTEKKLKDLTEFVHHLGVPCESLQSRFEIKRVIELANHMPEKHAINFAVLRSMQKAIYSPKEAGHYALSIDQYCHFTSPIRRYPDLVIHRMVGDLIDNKKPMSDYDVLERIGHQCSEMEQRAEQAERELIKLKLLNFLADRVGSTMEAVVTGVESFGLFVQGTDLPAEGLLPLEFLPADQYNFDAVTRTLQGHRAGNEFRLGDRLQVIVKLVDPDRRILNFALDIQQNRKKSGKTDTKNPLADPLDFSSSKRRSTTRGKASSSGSAERKSSPKRSSNSTGTRGNTKKSPSPSADRNAKRSKRKP